MMEPISRGVITLFGTIAVHFNSPINRKHKTTREPKLY